jgi:hypothetical protein
MITTTYTSGPPQHFVTLKLANGKKSTITTVKPWDSCDTEDPEGLLYARVRQFLSWREESREIDIRLEALLHAR